MEIVRSPDQITRIPAHGAHWHYHRAVELTCVQHGSSSCFVADQLRKFEAGEIFVLGEDVPHYWHHPRGSVGLSIQWEFPPEHGLWDLGEIRPLHFLQEQALRGLHVQGRTAVLATRQLEEMICRTGLDRLCAFLQLLHGLAQPHNRDVQPMADLPFDLSVTYDHEGAIQRALSYIQANYRESISLSDLLDLTGMSRTTFTRVFQQQTGKCFSTHVNHVRLEAVCRELRNSTKAVSCLAFDHGFTQLSFFNRLFRRELGASPSVYRERHHPSHSAGTKRSHALSISKP